MSLNISSRRVIPSVFVINLNGIFLHEWVLGLRHTYQVCRLSLRTKDMPVVPNYIEQARKLFLMFTAVRP